MNLEPDKLYTADDLRDMIAELDAEHETKLRRNPYFRWAHTKRFADTNLYRITRHPSTIPTTITHTIRAWRNRRIRGQQGWTPYDTGDLDTYIIHILTETIDYFRHNLHSHPGTITHEEWLDILERIATGLKHYKFEDGLNPEPDSAKFQEAWTLLGEWLPQLWD